MMGLAKSVTIFIDWFYIAPIKRVMPIQTYHYAICGGANLVFSWVLYAFCYRVLLDREILQLSFIAFEPHIAAFGITFVVTLFSGFWLQRNIAFSGSPLRGRVQLMRYIFSLGGSVAINYVGLKILVEYLGWYATLSQIAISLVTIVYSYLMQKYFTFKGSLSD